MPRRKGQVALNTALRQGWTYRQLVRISRSLSAPTPNGHTPHPALGNIGSHPLNTGQYFSWAKSNV